MMSIPLPPPPDGYETWLDYAVQNFDCSSIRGAYLFDEEFGPLNTDALKSLVRAEFAALKARADALAKETAEEREWLDMKPVGGELP